MNTRLFINMNTRSFAIFNAIVLILKQNNRLLGIVHNIISIKKFGTVSSGLSSTANSLSAELLE